MAWSPSTVLLLAVAATAWVPRESPRVGWRLAGRATVSAASADDDATLTGLVPPAVSPYRGPSPAGGALKRVQAVLEVPDYGLAFTVAESVVAPDGFGVFVAVMDGARNVTVPAGTPLGGLGTASSMRDAPGDADRTVRFELGGSSEDINVMFEAQVCRLQDLLVPSSVTKFGLTGLPGLTLDDGQTRPARHVLRPIRDKLKLHQLVGHDAEELQSRSGAEGKRTFYLTPTGTSVARYFTPDPVAPDSADLRTVGQFVNDLAFDAQRGVHGAVDEYERASQASNVLVLQWNLEEGAAGRLTPKVPVPCLCFFDQTVSFDNKTPMELGCRYGFSYWRERAAGDVLGGVDAEEVSID